MSNIYIISGCNGAGKTTASFTVLPEMFNCREFVNADEIAKGLSPFQPDKVAIEAGRIMLNRINTLIDEEKDFAFETTLATRYYAQLINNAQLKGYFVTLVFFWLNSPELAIERVKTRVKAGGHDIQKDVVLRRYNAGISNLSNLYLPICNYWFIFDNSEPITKPVAEGFKTEIIKIYNQDIYNQIVKP